MPRLFTRARQGIPSHRSSGGTAAAQRPVGARAASYACTDNQAALLPKIRAERLRRALLAHCERAPLGWDKDCG
jgi:hypothetical protein